MCACLLVHCECLWISGSVEEFIIIVGGIDIVFSNL